MVCLEWANRCTILVMFEELGTAIDGLDIPAHGAALAAVVALRDRLDARISDAVATQDRAGLWELDGATSMTAWLTHHTRMPRPRAAATTARARKLAQLPVTARAWRDGTLSTGQVDVIAAHLDPHTVALFAEKIGSARTVFWNGPLGAFEFPPFDKGSVEAARAVADVTGLKVIGGGDSLLAVQRAGVAERMTHLSTGGGASLEFLEGRTLPGLKALEVEA